MFSNIPNRGNYSNFENGIVGEYQVSFMKENDDKSFNYVMFDSLDEAKAKSEELMKKDYTVFVLKKKAHKNGSYSWEILPLANHNNGKYYKYLILTLCVIIIILAVSKLRR